MTTKGNDLTDRIKQVGDIAEKISDAAKIFTGDDSKKSKKSDDDNVLGKIGDLLSGSDSSKKSKKSDDSILDTVGDLLGGKSKSGKKIKQAGGKSSSGGLGDIVDKAEDLKNAKDALDKIQGIFKSKKWFKNFLTFRWRHCGYFWVAGDEPVIPRRQSWEYERESLNLVLV